MHIYISPVQVGFIKDWFHILNTRLVSHFKKSITVTSHINDLNEKNPQECKQMKKGHLLNILPR